MNVTILGDASHCPETLAGGYGFWIACERGKRGGSGAFREVVPTSTVAEMMAIVNALYCALRFELVLKGDALLIQTDCEAAIFALTDRRKLTTLESECVLKMKQFIKDNALEVVYKHVKGHSKNKQSRFLSNNACDRGAKKAMRKKRASLTVTKIRSIIDKAPQHETIS